MKLFHRHKWIEVQRDFAEVSNFHFPGEMLLYKGPLTTITFKCSECPKYKQIYLRGHISPEQTDVPAAFKDAFE